MLIINQLEPKIPVFSFQYHIYELKMLEIDNLTKKSEILQSESCQLYHSSDIICIYEKNHSSLK